MSKTKILSPDVGVLLHLMMAIATLGTLRFNYSFTHLVKENIPEMKRRKKKEKKNCWHSECKNNYVKISYSGTEKVSCFKKILSQT